MAGKKKVIQKSDQHEFKKFNQKQAIQENSEPKEYDPVTDQDIKAFQENVLKFKDSLIASTSASMEEIQIWEPKTLAPYEPILEKKFVAGSNTLCVNAQNYIWAQHLHKSIMNVWRWDKKDPIMKFPIKDQLNIFRMSASEINSAVLCVGGSKKGLLSIWQASTGQLIAEVESAHYMEINSLDISNANSDMIITGGKDCKVRVWLLQNLLSQDPQVSQNYYAEFGEHQQEVTQVAFSQNNSSRAFSASVDKQFKVYDLSQKMCIKTIQIQSPILKMIMDSTESNLYVACDNQNIYCYGMEMSQIQPNETQQGRSRQKKTLQHKKKVTALCLSVDGTHLISGDQTGVIYIWSTQAMQTEESGLISTHDLHKDKGAITNLVSLYRPLSLFGLTANMKAFEAVEIMPLQKFKGPVDNVSMEMNVGIEEFLRQEQTLESKFQLAEEDNYFVQAAQRMMNEITTSQSQNKKAINGNGKSSEIDQLREENRKLKRTLSERFDGVYQ